MKTILVHIALDSDKPLKYLERKVQRDITRLLKHSRPGGEARVVDDDLTPEEQAYRDAAHDLYHKDGELEIDEATIVSISPDTDDYNKPLGAYVLAWRWVYRSDTSLAEDDNDDDPEDGSSV